MTILVVEDDEDSAFLLTRLLKTLGHEVVAVADGVEAWSLLQRRRVDLVLSDWMMPGSDGLELCRRIRALSGRPYTYVVVVTARGGSDDRLEALAAGADDFLAKPFDPRELVARLGIADRLLAMQEELERKNDELRALATTDELTGLKNRRRFFEELETQFALAARGSGRRSRWCSWTWTTSRRTTTPSATRPATTSCGASPTCFGASPAATRRSPATAARSSPSCSPGPARTSPGAWPSGCARPSSGGPGRTAR